ncbi:hypothetical protein Ato02nite_013890 [Paractinoplanes toevensis]|uniref:Uncharacterized protein n=1 Tax=Paractinoplanes toevensis TaxID=571911 RepID=A0A919T7P8_9ACTN|nr:hypothetical protein Ato02nite_013890 [Actinoplanes toevensis]
MFAQPSVLERLEKSGNGRVQIIAHHFRLAGPPDLPVDQSNGFAPSPIHPMPAKRDILTLGEDCGLATDSPSTAG